MILIVGKSRESLLYKMETTKTLVKVLKSKLSVKNGIHYLKQPKGRLTSSHPLKSA